MRRTTHARARYFLRAREPRGIRGRLRGRHLHAGAGHRAHALRLAGAAYLILLGAQSLYAAVRRGRAPRPAARLAELTPRKALRQGALSNLGNPKMAVFFASLLPQFAPGGNASFAALLALGLLFAALTLVWLALYALAVARLQRYLTGPLRRALDAVTGLVLVAFGVRLAGERR